MHILTPLTPPVTLWGRYYICHLWNPLESLLGVKTPGWFCFRKWSYSVIWFVKHVTVGLWMQGQWNPWTCMHCPSLEAGTLAHSLRCSCPRWRDGGELSQCSPWGASPRPHYLVISLPPWGASLAWSTDLCGAYNHPDTCVSIAFFDSSCLAPK